MDRRRPTQPLAPGQVDLPSVEAGSGSVIIPQMKRVVFIGIVNAEGTLNRSGFAGGSNS